MTNIFNVFVRHLEVPGTCNAYRGNHGNIVVYETRAEAEAEIIATLTNGGASRIKRNGYAVQLKTSTDGPAVLEIRSA